MALVKAINDPAPTGSTYLRDEASYFFFQGPEQAEDKDWFCFGVPDNLAGELGAMVKGGVGEPDDLAIARSLQQRLEGANGFFVLAGSYGL